MKTRDIRSYFMKEDAAKIVKENDTSSLEEPISAPDKNGNERMKMMRGKMTRCRKRQELLEKRKQKFLNRQRVSKTYKGKRIIEAKDVIHQEGNHSG